MSKQCTKCRITKPFNEFSQSNPTKKDGYNSWCKQCCRDSSRRSSKTPAGVYAQIKGRQTYYNKRNHSSSKPFNISKQAFIEWYENQPKICVYCSVDEKNLSTLRGEMGSRTERLTVDCIDNDLGYVVDNIVLACDKCNISKNNIFTYDEMWYIGQNFIKPKWEKLLDG